MDIPLPKRVHPRVLEGKGAYVDSVYILNNPFHLVVVAWPNQLSKFCDLLTSTIFL